jgi:hypothetical protein
MAYPSMIWHIGSVPPGDTLCQITQLLCGIRSGKKEKMKHLNFTGSSWTMVVDNYFDTSGVGNLPKHSGRASWQRRQLCVRAVGGGQPQPRRSCAFPADILFG